MRQHISKSLKWLLSHAFTIFSCVAIIALGMGAVAYATTIGTNISTDGNLTVNGNVGIGTTVPSYNLDVNGDVNLAAGSVYRIGGVAQLGSSKWTAGTGDNIYRNSGNVGIGTTTPSAKFEVYTALSGGLRIYGNGGSANIVGGFTGNTIDGGIGNIIAGGGSVGMENLISGVDNHRSILGGYDNQIGTSIVSVIGGGAHNIISDSSTHATISGGSVNLIEDGEYNTISGGTNNSIVTGHWSNISGGTANTTNANDAVVGGGVSNDVFGERGTISGGGYNTARGAKSVIGGGSNNEADGVASVIGGGEINVMASASTPSYGDYSSILGGQSNSLGTSQSAIYSAIIGGRLNVVNGEYSFAFGRKIHSTGNGITAFTDSQDATFTVNTPNVFAGRFSGGYLLTGGNVGIGTTTPATKLDVDGIIKTQPRSTATCNTLSEGGIYYDSDDKHFYGCNGTAWVQLDN